MMAANWHNRSGFRLLSSQIPSSTTTAGQCPERHLDQPGRLGIYRGSTLLLLRLGRRGHYRRISPAPRRTVQQFEMAMTSAITIPATPQYGGFAIPSPTEPQERSGLPRRPGSTYLFTPTPHSESTYLIQPPVGAAAIPGVAGAATSLIPLITSFPVTVEGRHGLTARLSNPGDPPARLYVKVDYLGPAVPTAF